MKGDFGSLPIEVPRDRNSEFEPKIVPKGKTRLDGFNEKILSLYARGMTVREIQQHIQEISKVEVSPTLISNVTEAVMEDVVAWQTRPLEAIYPILYMDALHVKIRDGAHKAVHLAIGVTADLQKIYRAATRAEAELRLSEFAEKWDAKYPTISQSWQRNWECLIPFLAYPAEIRRVIYTTNAIESTNMSLRKIIKNRGSFPSDEAALKLLYLALRNITRRWTMPIKDWRAALNRFAIIFEDRMPAF